MPTSKTPTSVRVRPGDLERADALAQRLTGRTGGAPVSRSAVLTLALTRGLDVLAAELAGPAEGPSPAAPAPRSRPTSAPKPAPDESRDSPLLTLGARAYAWRTAGGLSTKAAAERARIAPEAWRAIEAGNPPPAGALARIETLIAAPAHAPKAAPIALDPAAAVPTSPRDAAILAFARSYRDVFGAEYSWNMAPGEDGDKLSRWLDELDLSRARLRAPVLEAGIARLRAGALAFCRSVKAGTTPGPADARRFTEGLSVWLPRAP